MPTTDTTQGSNAWNGWDVEVLHDLGAKPSKNNIMFLDWWQSYEHSNAKNNPLNLTAPAGTGSINSAGVQNYSSPALGAQYTANLISSGNYPTIYKMLKTDNLKGVLLGNTSISSKGDLGHGPLENLVAELRKWGSGTFADKLAGGESTASQTVQTYDSVTSWLGWISQNWDRVLFIIGGGVLVILALVMVGKQQTQKNMFTFARGDE